MALKKHKRFFRDIGTIARATAKSISTGVKVASRKRTVATMRKMRKEEGVKWGEVTRTYGRFR